MNTVSPSTTFERPTVEVCATCRHPLSAHDATGTRWCAATTLGIGQRQCICSGQVAEARTLSHY